ncbi:MAG: hypothetical protein O3A20_01295 [Planctomycetota bacterium]|nr:hypothetical protein [Planctomycetota bacterium]
MTRAFAPLLFALAGGAAAWWIFTPSGDPADKLRIGTLEAEVGRLEGEVARRDLQLQYLRERKRIARVDQVERAPDPASPDGNTTRFRFQELDEAGQPLGPVQNFALHGDLAYFDALVVKFDDRFVEENDLLRGSSLLLFRRIFGEHQRPAEGFQIDTEGQRPNGYANGSQAQADFHRDLWNRFWDYALDPEVARQAGVRAMHGEAPFVKLVPGRAYEIELRLSEGLVVRAVPDPGPVPASAH